MNEAKQRKSVETTQTKESNIASCKKRTSFSKKQNKFVNIFIKRFCRLSSRFTVMYMNKSNRDIKSTTNHLAPWIHEDLVGNNIRIEEEENESSFYQWIKKHVTSYHFLPSEHQGIAHQESSRWLHILLYRFCSEWSKKKLHWTSANR